MIRKTIAIAASSIILCLVGCKMMGMGATTQPESSTTMPATMVSH